MLVVWLRWMEAGSFWVRTSLCIVWSCPQGGRGSHLGMK